MEFKETAIEDLILIKPKVFYDERGFFLENYSYEKFKKAGIDCKFVQDNHSYSKTARTLRGLHFQKEQFAQSKLIRVLKGKIFDVAVDLRQNSETYGRYISFILSSDNFLMLFIPKGFAHGFCTIDEDTEVEYKVDNYYNKESESGIIWNDPDLHIFWPTNAPIISEKDGILPQFKEIQL
jgi:dTDP-4-dehydrorhamnose 3,5-epimerase